MNPSFRLIFSARVAAVFLAVSGAPLLASCDRAPPQPHSSVTKATSDPNRPTPLQEEKTLPSGHSDTLAQQPTRKAEPYRFSDAKSIVAIGDLHGDFAATLKAFELAGAIDHSANWKGGKMVVVQTGDQLDRGNGEREILQFLSRLKKEAKAAGGELIVLNGNHEAMNVLGDFRYVTPGALDAFSSLLPKSKLAEGTPSQFRQRAEAFLPGGAGAQILAERPLIAMVGKTVFVHGGVLPAHVAYGIDRLNRETRDWMLGTKDQPPAPVLDPEGPLWTRLYGPRNLGTDTCKVLEATLKSLGATRMVVGHSVQDKGLSSACNEQVYRIDVGLAAYYGDRDVQVLAINGGQVEILTAKP